MKTFEDALNKIKENHEVKEIVVGHNKNGLKITFVETKNGNMYMIRESKKLGVQTNLLN